MEIPVDQSECPFTEEWFEENINKEEYNIWHRETRHLDYYFCGCDEDAQHNWSLVEGTEEPVDQKVMNKIQDEQIREWICDCLDEMESRLFLAVSYDRDMSTKEYTQANGLNYAATRKKLQRIREKLMKLVTTAPLSRLHNEEVF
ncbi:hypothetical protein [Faecalibaculum rodentium]|uniref:hypothetical protein n=1 Tax=Faecalibaculum rodentium TaxID=1702221 RepID=UPI0023F4CCA3|nr:hypothetical protein [Faecalibaculum rodentium]